MEKESEKIKVKDLTIEHKLYQVNGDSTISELNLYGIQKLKPYEKDSGKDILLKWENKSLKVYSNDDFFSFPYDEPIFLNVSDAIKEQLRIRKEMLEIKKTYIEKIQQEYYKLLDEFTEVKTDFKTEQNGRITN